MRKLLLASAAVAALCGIGSASLGDDPDVVVVAIGHWSGGDIGLAFYDDWTFGAATINDGPGHSSWVGQYGAHEFMAGHWDVKMRGDGFRLDGIRVDDRFFAVLRCGGSTEIVCFQITYDGC